MARLTHEDAQSNPKALGPEQWLWVEQHLGQDTQKLRLKYGTEEPYNTAIAQIEARSKYSGKFGSLCNTKWIFPKGLALEQSSSEATAKWKSTLFTTAYSADLCAGMGVDSALISNRTASKGHLCFEKNESLAHLLQHNLPEANIQQGEFSHEDLKKWIESHALAAKDLTIYLDPDRRAGSQREFKLEHCTPNLVEEQHELLEVAHTIVAKHSPMVDLDHLATTLKALSEIWVVQYRGECKEIVSIQRNLGRTLKINAIDISSGETYSGESRNSTNLSYGPLDRFIIQPSPGLNKSSLHEKMAHEQEWTKLPFGHLYTAQNAPSPNPFYKVYEVLETFDSLKKISINEGAAVECIGSKITVAELRKRLKIKEGRDRKLFYLQNGRTKVIVIGRLQEK